MAEGSITSKEEDSQGYLSDFLFELSHAQYYLAECDIKKAEPDVSILRLLLEVVAEKIYYYENKYDMKADVGDLFYLEDISKFFHKAEEFHQARIKQAQTPSKPSERDFREQT
jgi:hypothetical protein